MANTTNKPINKKTVSIFVHSALIGLFVYLSIGLFSPAASAQGVSLGVNPPIIVIQADPPASITTPLTIHNLSNKSASFQIMFKPFHASDAENGEVKYLPEGETIPGPDQELFDKVQIMDNDNVIDTVVLGPQQEKTLTLHVGIPEDEPIADYYFSVIFLNKKDQSSPTNSSLSQTIGGIATNVLLSIGKEPAQGTVTEFSVPGFLEHGPVPFTVRIRNTGTHVIAPKGSIIIKNMFGQAVGKVDLLPVNILTKSTRAIPDTSQNPEKKRKSSVNLPLLSPSPVSYWYENFLLGFYTATLTVSLSNKGPVYTSTTHFSAFPFTAFIGLLVACFIVLLIRKKLQKRLKDT